jgi:chromate transporter
VWSLAAYFLRLGATGFGGPVALVGYMERDLVHDRKVVTADEFSAGLAFSQMAPGPLAAQLAIYIGWLRGGVVGASTIGLAFIGPSFIMVVALAAAYVRYGGLAWMQGAFTGIAAAVIAVMARSVVRLARSTLRQHPVLWATAVANAVVVAVMRSEIIWVIVLSGLIVPALARMRIRTGAVAATAVPVWLTALAGSVGTPVAQTAAPTLASLVGYFAKAGSVVFGSGLAIVPYLHGGVVEAHHWTTERQFLDAVAVSMITPGPIVIMVAFVGYLVAGLSGAGAAAVGVFLPVYLSVVVLAPVFTQLLTRPAVRQFVAGVTAAATGAIAGAVFVLADRALVDGFTLGVAIVAAGAPLVMRKLPDPLLVVAGGLVGALRGLSAI